MNFDDIEGTSFCYPMAHILFSVRKTHPHTPAMPMQHRIAPPTVQLYSDLVVSINILPYQYLKLIGDFHFSKIVLTDDAVK